MFCNIHNSFLNFNNYDSYFDKIPDLNIYFFPVHSMWVNRRFQESESWLSSQFSSQIPR